MILEGWAKTFPGPYFMAISRLSLYALLLCLVACGGGSGGVGGSDNNDDGGGFDPPVDNAEPLEYQGSRFPAVLDATNVGYFVYNTFADSAGRSSAEAATASVGSSAGFNIAAISHSGGATPRLFPSQVQAGTRFKQRKKPMRSSGADNAAFSIAAVSDSYDYAEKSSESCESGQVDTYLMMYDDGSGLMVLDYRDCREDGVLTDGLVTYNIYESDSVIRHALIQFNRLRTRINGVNYFSGGSIEFEYNPPHERRVMNVIYEVEDGEILEFENMVFEAEGNVEDGNYSETITGRIYGNTFGYVDIATLLPVVYVNHIPQEGEMLLTGGDDSKALLEFPGGFTGFTVSLNTDGDEVYEDYATLSLARLAFENTDIGDDDGDGMHNSWENFYGLDPEDPSDAALDLDGDSVSNSSEYRLGFDPEDAGAAPTSSDLEVSIESFTTTSFYLVVRNNGPDPASSVRVRFTTSSGFELQTIITPYAHLECEITGENLLSCEFEELAAGASKEVRIGIDLPATPSSYEAVVSSKTSADPDESNNTLAESATAELTARFLESSTPSSYVMQVENTGILAATQAQSQLILPEGVTGISINAASSNGSCTSLFLTRWVVSCRHNTIQPGESYTITVSLTPAPGGEVEATFTAGSRIPEFNLADNEASFSGAPVTLVSDVYLDSLLVEAESTHTQWTLPVQPHTYGPSFLTEAQVTIELPPEFEFFSADDDYQCTGGHPLVCVIGRKPGFSQDYPSLRLTLRSQTPGLYEFPVSIETAANDPDLSNNTGLVKVFIGDQVSSIQAQIDAAAEGATIEVPAGYYFGRLSYSKNINLVGVAGPQNTFWAVTTTHSIRNATSGEITGFTFGYGNAPVIVLSNSDVNIHGNVFENLDGNAGQAISINSSDAILDSNIIKGMNCGVSAGGIIAIEGQGSPVIRNNLLLNNACTGIYSGNSAGELAGQPVIVNNHFVGNSTGILLPIAENADFYIGNNIFYDNNTAIKMAYDCGMQCPVFQSNLLYNNDVDYVNIPDQTGSNGNIGADPLFTDRANGDYTLQSGSPAIDVGDALHVPTDDFAGNLRPVDGDASTTAEPDIGAYEFQPPPD
jgi:hypothetical protein